jgi:hypothetical protein
MKAQSRRSYPSAFPPAPSGRVWTALTGLFLILSVLIGCEGEGRVAGGGGVDVEGITVEGTAMRADKTPVAGARVRLRAWDFQHSAAAPKAALEGGDTRTDSLGRFRFQDVDSGRYALEVDAGKDGSAVLEIEADGSQRTLTLEAFVQPQGSLAGSVRDSAGNPIAGVRVGLLGLDRETVTDTSGSFVMAGLPAGVYTLRLQPPTQDWSALELPVEVRGDGRTGLDPVILPASSPDILARWRFDEGSGSVAAEAQGSPARAILRSGAGWAQALDGTGLSLPAGSGGYAFVPKTKSSPLDLDSGADFTLSVWIRTASAGAGAGGPRRVLDARADYAPEGYALGLSADGTCEFLIRPIGSAAEWRLAGGTALDDGAWHALIATRSGTRYALYVDGKPTAEAEGPAGALTRDNALYFGIHEGKTFGFAGLLDDVRILKRALSAEEAAALSVLPTP